MVENVIKSVFYNYSFQNSLRKSAKRAIFRAEIEPAISHFRTYTLSTRPNEWLAKIFILYFRIWNKKFQDKRSDNDFLGSGDSNVRFWLGTQPAGLNRPGLKRLGTQSAGLKRRDSTGGTQTSGSEPSISNARN